MDNGRVGVGFETSTLYHANMTPALWDVPYTLLFCVCLGVLAARTTKPVACASVWYPLAIPVFFYTYIVHCPYRPEARRGRRWRS